MAHFLYAVCGQGRGHSSRVLAMTEALRARGHTVTLACGGHARRIFEARGEAVVPVPALQEVLAGNRLRLWATARLNAATVLRTPALLRRLAHVLDGLAPDLVVSDFEPFMPRAAARVGLPVVSFNHQELLTEAHVPPLPGMRLLGGFMRTAIRTIAPPRPTHRLVTALTALPLGHPERTTLVGPILRRAVREARPHRDAHLLAYFNGERGLEQHLAALAAPGVPVRVYGTGRTGTRGALQFQAPSFDGFIEDLATCRGVVSTAGFTLLSESLHLGKPVLALPHEGDYEQTFNARLVETLGVGHAVYRRAPEATDVRRFLDLFGDRPVSASAVLAPGHTAALVSLESFSGAPAAARPFEHASSPAPSRPTVPARA